MTSLSVTRYRCEAVDMSRKIHTRRSEPADDGGNGDGDGEEKKATAAQLKLTRQTADCCELLDSNRPVCFNFWTFGREQLLQTHARLGTFPEQRPTSCSQRPYHTSPYSDSPLSLLFTYTPVKQSATCLLQEYVPWPLQLKSYAYTICTERGRLPYPAVAGPDEGKTEGCPDWPRLAQAQE